MIRGRARKPLNSGTYGCVPVRPILPVSTLASIDADGVVASAGITARSGRRLHRKALREAERERVSWDSRMRQERPRSGDDEEGGERLPMTTSTATGLVRYAPKIPWHMASVSESGMLSPLGISGWPRLMGPIIGHSVINGNVWRFDAWSPYRYDGTSVNGWIIGTMGSGKSTLLKAFATRETAPPWNRQVLIEGDPKGEWASVALANGGQVVEVGNGRYLNPLDVAEKPATVTDADWASTVFGLRVGALESIASVLRKGRVFDPGERAVVSAALEELQSRTAVPTVAGLTDLLDSEWKQHVTVRGMQRSQVERTASDLTIIYNTLVEGDLKGGFERESTVDLDPSAPMIVFNTGSVGSGEDLRKRLYNACMNSAVDRLCYSHDGRFRIIIAEEGYELLQDPALVKAWQKRMRLCGDLGTSSWMLMHELQDIEKFAPEGSDHLKQIKSILTLSGVQIIYSQSPASLKAMGLILGDDLSETELLTIEQLPAHWGLWRVGKQIRDVVQADMGSEASRLFSTDANRAG